MDEPILHRGRQLAGLFDDDTLLLISKMFVSTLYFEAFDKLIDGIAACSQ